LRKAAIGLQSNLEARLFEGTGPACIIAEAGPDHNGDIARAKAEHLKVVRPGGGISPGRLPALPGKKAAVELEEGSIIAWTDLQ